MYGKIPNSNGYIMFYDNNLFARAFSAKFMVPSPPQTKSLFILISKFIIASVNSSFDSGLNITF